MLVAAARYVIKVVPTSTAISITRALAERTRPVTITPSERDALSRAVALPFEDRGEHIAWSWGQGPAVIMVHGWGGRAAQMAPLAEHIAGLGFRSIAFDITGHGDSPKRNTRWAYFVRDIAAASKLASSDVYAFVGHSAGALSMMATRRLRGIRAVRYVCICAPSHPFPPIRAIRSKLDPTTPVVDAYQAYIAGQFETTWEQLELGTSYAGAGPDTLLVYDEADRFVDHTEGDKIRSLCPGARLVKTEAYGHVKVLGTPELAQIVGSFLLESQKA